MNSKFLQSISGVQYLDMMPRLEPEQGLTSSGGCTALMM